MHRERTKETLYLKWYKEDCRVDGFLYALSPLELSTLLRLECHADKNGVVSAAYGKGYKTSELSTMLNLDYRNTKQAIARLQAMGLIKVLISGVVQIQDFVYNDNMRFKYKLPYPAQGVRESLGIPEPINTEVIK